jgi:hypothetical protein
MLTESQLEEVKASLFSGQYNLLLGSGVSLDSFDRNKKQLIGVSELTEELCALKGARAGTTLARVSLLLSKEETKEQLTDRYIGCKPGETVSRLTNFIWKSVFTFNIDDTLEAAYETQQRPRQIVESLNYDTVYQSPANRSQLPIVHLHGFVREQEKGFVFSVAEYGRVTRGLNPWMHVLSELLASEPFIISGTSLNESDLEYYLGGRTEVSPRKNRGPSILVEPFPDAVTESDCQRHGLLLVKAKLNEFLRWLGDKLGAPPTVQELLIPAVTSIFHTPPTQLAQVAFFTDFYLVRPVASVPDSNPTSFFYGRPPSWHDLESGMDIPTVDESSLSRRARHFLDDPNSRRRVICVLSEAGSGKTTCLRRVAYNLAQQGQTVLYLNSKGDLDIDNAAICFGQIARPFVVVIDGLADHVSTVRALVTNSKETQPFLVLSAERQYRQAHIDRLLGDLALEFTGMSSWPRTALVQLIEKYRQYGLVGSSDAIKYPEKYADELHGEAVAISTCRILNNFRPLDKIVKSLWNDSTEAARRSFLIAALAEFCYSGGLYYPVLEAAHANVALKDQISFDYPLPLAYADDDDYILPLHAIIADRIILLAGSEKKAILLEAFTKLASAIAPYVNRKTIISRAPEAKLTARLFNVEQVVRNLLGDFTEEFFKNTQESWQWNSRYWEQRALWTEQSDIDTAIQYARHATAIESHPYPWTTLASILVRKMEATSSLRDIIFPEAIELLDNVFRFEERRGWRPTPHPYSTLLHCASVFLDLGGTITPVQKASISARIEKCQQLFSRDTTMQGSAATLARRLQRG